MNPVLRRIVFGIALLCWSMVMLYFYGSGRIVKYLAPDFRIITLLGALGLLVTSGFILITARRKVACGHDHDDGGCHAHEETDVPPWIALVLMLAPVALAVGWTKDQYSIATLERKGLYETPSSSQVFFGNSMPVLTREQIESSHRKTADGFYEFSLMELFFSAGDRAMQGVIDGMKVETEGRWVDEKVRNPNGTRKRLYRLFMTCCAADSQAVPIVLEFNAPPPEFPANGWVKVSGTMTYPLEDGRIQPLLVVERVLAAEAPYEETFLRN
ncbi:MAG: hypothetical protein V4733_08870 [Verrucomicrobiota bacterium]